MVNGVCAATGKGALDIVWERPGTGSEHPTISETAIGLTEHEVVVARRSGVVESVNVSTGETRWSATVPAGAMCPVEVLAGAWAVSHGQGLTWLDPQGREAGTWSGSAVVACPALHASGDLIVITGESRLSRIGPRGQRWVSDLTVGGIPTMAGEPADIVAWTLDGTVGFWDADTGELVGEVDATPAGPGVPRGEAIAWGSNVVVLSMEQKSVEATHIRYAGGDWIYAGSAALAGEPSDAEAPRLGLLDESTAVVLGVGNSVEYFSISSSAFQPADGFVPHDLVAELGPGFAITSANHLVAFDVLARALTITSLSQATNEIWTFQSAPGEGIHQPSVRIAPTGLVILGGADRVVAVRIPCLSPLSMTSPWPTPRSTQANTGYPPPSP